MKNQSPLFKSVRALTLAAMLAAMSVVIGIFCKTLLNFGNGLMRITFENLPIIISGMLFGPIAGGAVGAASDLMSYLLSPQTYPPNLIVTLGATTVGVVSGVISHYIVKKRGVLQTIICILSILTLAYIKVSYRRSQKERDRLRKMNRQMQGREQPLQSPRADQVCRA